jgi:hypothetical protein
MLDTARAEATLDGNHPEHVRRVARAVTMPLNRFAITLQKTKNCVTRDFARYSNSLSSFLTR